MLDIAAEAIVAAKAVGAAKAVAAGKAISFSPDVHKFLLRMQILYSIN